MILIFRRQQFGLDIANGLLLLQYLQSDRFQGFLPNSPLVSLVLPLRLHEQEILLKGLSYCDVFQGDNM